MSEQEKERIFNLHSKMRSFIRTNAKKINCNAVLGLVLGLIVAISTLSVYINENMIYVVKVKDKPIGYIQNIEEYDKAVRLIEESDGKEVVKNITTKKTTDSSMKFLNAKEIEKIAREDLKLKMPGIIMYADGQEVAKVENVGAVDKIMKEVEKYYTSNYIDGNYKIISSNIKEKIVPTETLMYVEEMEDIDEVVQKIINGKGSKKSYIIKKGDTIWDIAFKNNINVEQIQAANPNMNIDKIKIGDEIKLAVIEPYVHVETVVNVKTVEAIPYEINYTYNSKKLKGYKSVSKKGSAGKAEVEKTVTLINGDVRNEEILSNTVLTAAVPEVVVIGTKKPTYYAGIASGGTGRFGWPLRGLISSRYGRRGREFHTGLDIAAPRGSNVSAADGGVVCYAGWNGGYGLCVMINHGNGYQTLYGHLSKISVKSGQKVSKGQKIGNCGSTGRSTGPHVHFEVRKNGSRVNPINYLK